MGRCAVGDDRKTSFNSYFEEHKTVLQYESSTFNDLATQA